MKIVLCGGFIILNVALFVQNELHALRVDKIFDDYHADMARIRDGN